MNGKENIIGKILADADEKCRQILNNAQAAAQQAREAANEAIENERKALNERIEALSGERVKNRLATAELDARKYKLNAKQKLIAECYDKAYAELKSMSASQKTAFIKNLIDKYAEQGETVYAAAADKEIVTQKFLDGFNKNLKLASKYSSADGGLVLEGKGYEKDLTLTRVVAYLREQTEGKVASALFGE